MHISDKLFLYVPFSIEIQVQIDGSGLDVVMSQVIFDMERFTEWMNQVVARGLHKKVKLMAGIIPARSLGMLRYMKKSVAGVSIPDSVLDRFTKASDTREEGLRFCVEQIEQFKKMEGIAGVHIMAIEWETAVRGIVEAAGLLPRPECS